ncbi:WhiB family transcription factor [Mycobacterium phage Shweta]|nr:WhiB family transcription factor [Mycobacterium phage Shweta]WRQ08187.1 4Fe-4S Wbl-type domain-containing protein [Mycobacterium phage dwieneke]
MSALPGVAQASHTASRPSLPTGWMEHVACAETRVDFTSEKPWEIKRAKAICASCPVIDDCLEYALTRRETHGVWGGRDAEQRALMARRRRRAAAQVGAR